MGLCRFFNEDRYVIHATCCLVHGIKSLPTRTEIMVQMPDMNTPKDGDFASYLDRLANSKADVVLGSSVQASRTLAEKVKAEPQTIQQVLGEGQEPTDEFVEEFKALSEAPELSDEELERQALSAPGEDGDVRTPE
jgi:hypothetical protein